MRLASEASGLLHNEVWETLMRELSQYRDSVTAELCKRGTSLAEDNEKRAMLFVVAKVLEFPHRLIEQGSRAHKALQFAEEQSRLKRQEDATQVVEVLGWNPQAPDRS